jgi:hypothetical protein
MMSFASTTRPHLALFAGLLALTSLGLRQTAYARTPRLGAAPAVLLPVAFEPNVGQSGAAPAIRYLARGAGYEAAFGPTEATLRLGEAGAPLTMRLLGANEHARMTAEEPLPGKAHYLLGNDRKRWRRHVPTFGRLRSRQVYPGIDLVYYGTPDKLEHDFIVAPGADPSRIQVEYAGAERVRLADDGRLILTVGGRDVIQHPAVAYQEVDGQRVTIPARYRQEEASSVERSALSADPTLAEVAPGAEGSAPTPNPPASPHPEGTRPEHPTPTRIGFELAVYDPTRPLVIDPVLDWSRQIEESNEMIFQGSMVRDAAGHLYLLGFTFTVGNFDAQDAVVRQLSPDGATILFTTHFGGSRRDAPNAIHVAPEGGVVVGGLTSSADFPTVNPLQAGPSGPNNSFITRLSADGSEIAYSTYVGRAWVKGLAMDWSGAISFAGIAFDTEFPTVNAFQPVAGGGGDAFVARLSADGSHLLYSTYLGGNESDAAVALGVDAAGRAYVTGQTSSANFPVRRAVQPEIGSFVRDGPDSFVAAFSPSGALRYATFLGGEAGEYPTALCAAPDGSVCAVGQTSSTRFPTKNALQPRIVPRSRNLSQPSDAYITRFSPDGRLVFSTYLGGRGGDIANAVTQDDDGNVYVGGRAGWTGDFFDDPQFPLRQSVQAFYGQDDAFVCRLPPDGSFLEYSTLLGGLHPDFATAIAAEGGDVWVAGEGSDYFPLTHPQPLDSPQGGAFLAHLTERHGRLSTRPGSVDFGTVTVGETKRRRLLVRNPGSRALGVTAASRADDVTVEPVSRLELRPGEEAAITLTFAPTRPGRLISSAAVLPAVALFTTDQGNATVFIPLMGRGQAVTVPE